jgi:hypothetical protein
MSRTYLLALVSAVGCTENTAGCQALLRSKVLKLCRQPQRVFSCQFALHLLSRGTVSTGVGDALE